MKKTIFVLGAGNGCGNRVAEKFGKNDFRVVLMARNPEHLAAYEAEFKEKGIEVYTQAADASKPHSVTKAFDTLKARFGTPDVLFYNVGITGLDTEIKGEKDIDLLVERYKVDVAGAYHAILQVLGEEFSQKQGTVLVTGGTKPIPLCWNISHCCPGTGKTCWSAGCLKSVSYGINTAVCRRRTRGGGFWPPCSAPAAMNCWGCQGSAPAAATERSPARRAF